MKSHLFFSILLLAACDSASQSSIEALKKPENNSTTSLGVSIVHLDQQFSTYTTTSLSATTATCGWHLPIAPDDAACTPGAIDILAVETDDERPTLLSTITLNENPDSGFVDNVLIEINSNSVDLAGLSEPQVIVDSIAFATTRDVPSDETYIITCPIVDTVCHLFSK